MARRIQSDARLERQIAAQACVRLIERNPRAYVVFRKAALRALRKP